MGDLAIVEQLVKRALERNAAIGNHLLNVEGGQRSGRPAVPFRHRQD